MHLHIEAKHRDETRFHTVPGVHLASVKAARAALTQLARLCPYVQLRLVRENCTKPWPLYPAKQGAKLLLDAPPTGEESDKCLRKLRNG